MDLFDINSSELEQTTEEEILDNQQIDKIQLEIEQEQFRKRFDKDEWQVISLYMSTGDCLLSYNRVFIGLDKKQAKIQSKEFFTSDRVINEIKRRVDILVRNNLHLVHKIIKEFYLMATSNMQDVASWEKWGVILKPSSMLSRDKTAAISEISMTRYGPKVKMYNKENALNSLAKILGVLRDSVDLSVENSTDTNQPVVIIPSNKREKGI